ncbi:MAG: hypothetical protein EKK55_16275 [Rhodocyclaceae bacterium]|nr:MAG: hypothetical protein EKK55_16275 [Rhodocyclaceae bacterium]
MRGHPAPLMPVSLLVAMSSEGIGKDDLDRYPLVASANDGHVAIQVKKSRAEDVLGPGGWPAVMPLLGESWSLSFNDTLVWGRGADALRAAFTVAAWATLSDPMKAALAEEPCRKHFVPVLFGDSLYLAERAPAGFEDALAWNTAQELQLEAALAADGRPGRVDFDGNSGYYYVLRGSPALAMPLWGGRYTHDAYARVLEAAVPGGALAQCSPETVQGIGALPVRAYFLAEECLRQGFATPPPARPVDETEAQDILVRRVAEADNWRFFVEAGGFSAKTND